LDVLSTSQDDKTLFRKAWRWWKVVWAVIRNIFYILLILGALAKATSPFETVALCLLVLILESVNWSLTTQVRIAAEEAFANRRMLSILLKAAGEDIEEFTEIVNEAERKYLQSNPSRKDKVLEVDSPEHRTVIDQLIKAHQSEQFWAILRSAQPDLAERIAESEIHRKRAESLAEFDSHLRSEDWKEPQWEKFFMRNQWIFGLGLRLQFLGVLQNQANYGGAMITRRGEQKGEFLMATEAIERFTVLVEIKRPDSPIFAENAEMNPYRNGVPGFSNEFANAISQVQVNSDTWTAEGSKRPPRHRTAIPEKSSHDCSPVHPRVRCDLTTER